MARTYIRIRANGTAECWAPSANYAEDSWDVSHVAKGRKPGVYRAAIDPDTTAGMYYRLGRRVDDPLKEAERLLALNRKAEGRRDAFTRSPGVAGFQQMANASQSAKDANAYNNSMFARMLKAADSDMCAKRVGWDTEKWPAPEVPYGESPTAHQIPGGDVLVKHGKAHTLALAPNLFPAVGPEGWLLCLYDRDHMPLPAYQREPILKLHFATREAAEDAMVGWKL